MYDHGSRRCRRRGGQIAGLPASAASIDTVGAIGIASMKVWRMGVFVTVVVCSWVRKGIEVLFRCQ